MEKFIDLLMRIGKTIGSRPLYWLIVGAALAIFIPLICLAVWIVVEVSGLMALRTGIREGYWVFLLVAANLNFAARPENQLFFVARAARNIVILAYFVNGVLMLWGDRPGLFWVLSAGLVYHVCSMVWPLRDPADETYVTSRREEQRRSSM